MLSLDFQALAADPQYRYWRFPKPSGHGWREIWEPEPALKKAQHKVLHEVLRPLLKDASPVVAAPRGRGPLYHASLHTAPSVLITADLEAFFDQVTARTIADALVRCGLATSRAELLARLCTRPRAMARILPQGAPTSPALADIVLGDLDWMIEEVVECSEARYSRYVDDIAISWPGGADARSAGVYPADIAAKVTSVLQVVRALTRTFGYKLQESKTKIAYVTDRQVVCGYVVNWEPGTAAVRAPRGLWRRLRAGVHRHRLGRTVDLERLRGLVGYLSSVDRGRVQKVAPELLPEAEQQWLELFG